MAAMEFPSRLSLLCFVQEKIRSLKQPLHLLPPREEWETFFTQFSEAAARLFEIDLVQQTYREGAPDLLPVQWDSPSDEFYDVPKTDAQTVLDLLTNWRTRISFAVRYENAELPESWELDHENLPGNPIKCVQDLSEFVRSLLRLLVESTQATSGESRLGAIMHKQVIADMPRELRNIQSSMTALGILSASEIHDVFRHSGDDWQTLTRVVGFLTEAKHQSIGDKSVRVKRILFKEIVGRYPRRRKSKRPEDRGMFVGNGIWAMPADGFKPDEISKLESVADDNKSPCHKEAIEVLKDIRFLTQTPRVANRASLPVNPANPAFSAPE